MRDVSTTITEAEAKALTTLERHNQIKDLKDLIKPYTRTISLLERTCTHAAVEIPVPNRKEGQSYEKAYYAKDKWRSDGAKCAGCGIDLGWFCPVSPVHYCDYEQADGTYDSDSCIHCGMPDERK